MLHQRLPEFRTFPCLFVLEVHEDVLAAPLEPPHHTSPPQAAEEYANFCANMVRRYAPGVPARGPSAPVPCTEPMQIS